MTGDAELVRAYARTRWRVELPDGRQALSLAVRVDPHAFPVPGGIVTAWNPASELRAREENERAQRALQGELRGAGLPHHPAFASGTGPDASSWDEPGFLVTGMYRYPFAELAARYGQNAVVWIGTDGMPILLAARHGFAGTRTGDIISIPT